MSRRPTNPERSFGIGVGGVLCALSLLFWWRGQTGRAELAVAAGSVLLVLGLTYSPVLKWPSNVWWALARALGYVMARVWLTVLFVVILTPVGLLWRLLGKDPLARTRSQATSWLPYPARYRDPKHYSRMY